MPESSAFHVILYSCFCSTSALLLAVATGCGGETKPRSIEEIQKERMDLPALYLTKSGKRVESAANQGLFIDKKSGEIAWPAYECNNPDCPGRGEDGSPFLFIWEDPRFYVAEDGTLGSKDFPTQQEWQAALKEIGGYSAPTCPRCMEIRNFGHEDQKTVAKYVNYVQQHVLPSTAARMKELDAEHAERTEYIKERIRQ